jgi:Ca2+-binding EF-hand superfamily protein
MPDIKAIREYAYLAFDHLDKNGNGFLERNELIAVLEGGVTEREKSFITFLLNNQENIADMVQEEGGGPSEGISRDDLESYFTLISALLS